MCKLKSAIIMKDRVFIPDYDSHSDMLAELGIEDTRDNAERLFVRAELSPRNGDVFTPLDEWVFTVDQDIRPDWFVEGYEKERMAAVVKEWVKSHIHVGVDGLIITGGSNHYIKDCKDVTIGGSANVEYIGGSANVRYIGDSANVEYIGGSANVGYIGGSANVKYIRDSANVRYIRGSANVEYIGGSANVEYIGGSANVGYIGDSANVEYIRGSAVVTASALGWANKDKLILSDNATFRDCQAKIIYQAGDWEFRSVTAKEAAT